MSGADLVPLASALAVAALAGLAAVIATRGVLRQVAGVLLALFGAGGRRRHHDGHRGQRAQRGGGPGRLAGVGRGLRRGRVHDERLVWRHRRGGRGAAGHAVMTGTPWRAAVLAGALLVFLAGLAAVLRGSRWPVMSARYDLPDRRGAAKAGAAAGAGGRGRRAPRDGAARDSASMWESLSGGDDPTADVAAVPERPRTAENR